MGHSNNYVMKYTRYLFGIV